ncbi:uncharacterized protein PFL1_04486 [Pseudozyma flocculosa PF-1]|uniref:C2H2-type domain-containing protein n=1 Tax=Pseudozyma flocculosa PF-1 TaxID=1277687 RepID=A0A061H6R9_9BASI|nr:uncharacterized protein PFL1_04486 [Pseudozyma flocculosa PF-1]EPQ28159.1 hypothetical protein PFL1_04486 [Pseudozyma flocculosa PF-1]
MTTLLQTPRTAHFPGMSQDLDHSYNDPSRATSASFQQQQPKDVGDSVYGAHYGEPASLAGRPTEAMFRFMAQDHVAPMETNSCPPDGPTYPAADFDGDLTSSSATMLGYPHPASSNGLRSDLADSTLSFPELPASLLDEAPEYEYSTHTRVNVFDAPQVFGDGFAETALGLGPDGTPLLGGNANDLALWSSSTDQSNEQAFQTDYLYQATAFDQPDEHGSLRAAGHPDTQIDGTLPGAADRIDAEGIARCPYPNCNKTFAKNRSYNLKAHLRSHSQMKPFACAVCPRAFSRKHDLERHARVHSGDKPYICEICGKGFPRSDALRRHWRVEKECGEKAAQLEAGQPFAAVMGAGGGHFGHEQGDIPGPHHHFNNEHQAWLEAQRRRIG